MNERIKDCFIRAYGYVPLPVEENIPIEMEKFANLIVQECIDIISPYAIRMENYDGGHPVWDIKKHFGIE